jgi:hypothetical protein
VNPDVASLCHPSTGWRYWECRAYSARAKADTSGLEQEGTRWLPDVSGMACEESHEE